MIEVNGAAHIILTVSQWDRARQFYSELLPFLGLAFASWQRRRGRADERAMRAWLDSLEKGHLDRAPD